MKTLPATNTMHTKNILAYDWNYDFIFSLSLAAVAFIGYGGQQAHSPYLVSSADISLTLCLNVIYINQNSIRLRIHCSYSEYNQKAFFNFRFGTLGFKVSKAVRLGISSIVPHPLLLWEGEVKLMSLTVLSDLKAAQVVVVLISSRSEFQLCARH